MADSINRLNADLFAAPDDDRARDPVQARKKAMDLLARREYARGELVARLESAGFDADIAVAAVDALATEGLQDDARYTEAFVRSRANRGQGPLRIRRELGARGVDAGAAEQALAEVGIDWHERARAVRLKKFGAARPGDFKEKARQMRFLQYRGFGPEHIEAALDAADEP